jgi:hypothetical protein
MKVYRICKQFEQANKVRAILGDYQNPSYLIARPVGMRRVRFRQLIRKLERHENKAAELFGLGLKQYRETKDEC